MNQKLGLFIVRTKDAKEAVKGLLPLVDVVVTLLVRSERILAVYNENWGAFTLPSTKRRTWDDPHAAKGAVREEAWEDAAVRAAAEWIGATTTIAPEFMGDISEFQQSDRDGKWKRYCVKSFRMPWDAGMSLTAGKISQWLTVEEFLDEKRRPISPTARHAIAELRLAGKL